MPPDHLTERMIWGGGGVQTPKSPTISRMIPLPNAVPAWNRRKLKIGGVIAEVSL